MAISSTYYINAPSLSSATSVFSNATLTTLAADGFYSDGLVSRQQLSGVLLPEQNCASTPTATLSWTFAETNASVGSMKIYVNGSIIENRIADSSGTWDVSLGDVIYVEVTSSGCSGGNGKANAYCTGIIDDAACANGSTSLTSTTYTVLSSDLGTTLTLDVISRCDTGCV